MKTTKRFFQLMTLTPAMALLAACGGSVTVADVPDNFTGSYSGTVNGFPATLSIVQTTSTTTENNQTVTTQAFTGTISVNTNSGAVPTATSDDPNCSYAETLSQGSSAGTSVSLSGEEVTVSLNRSGPTLTGSVTYTGDPITFDDDKGTPGDTTDDDPIGCPLPNGVATFRR